MASGSYAKQRPRKPIESPTVIPPRATRQLEAVTCPEEVVAVQEQEIETQTANRRATRGLLDAYGTDEAATEKPRNTTASLRRSLIGQVKRHPTIPIQRRPVVDEFAPHPLARHRPWLNPLLIGIVFGGVFLSVLLSAAMYQRPGDPQLIRSFGGRSYDIQVGGPLVNTWQSNQPMQPKVKIPASSGPYSVLGKPTIKADFINTVLANYNSPAAGKGQALYDLGAKYGIDPAFALAFFMHESTFGTMGEATKTRSLSNMRCIPTADCVDQDRGGYASFPSWEAGFEAFYKLIRNLYVAEWGRTTVDQIIPKYAPSADNNNETAYINSVKHSIDTWRAGEIRP